jgi:protein ImuA
MKGGGVCVWISTARNLFPPALKIFGVIPEQVIFIDVQKEKEVSVGDGRSIEMRRACLP